MGAPDSRGPCGGVFLFASNSCETDGWKTLIRAEMGQHPKQMSKAFSSEPPSERRSFPRGPSPASTGRSGIEIKGARVKKKKKGKKGKKE